MTKDKPQLLSSNKIMLHISTFYHLLAIMPTRHTMYRYFFITRTKNSTNKTNKPDVYLVLFTIITVMCKYQTGPEPTYVTYRMALVNNHALMPGLEKT